MAKKKKKKLVKQTQAGSTKQEEKRGGKKNFFEKLLDNPQAVVSLLAVIVSVVALTIPFATLTITKNEKAAQRDAARSERLTRAIDHLKDDLLAIRMGALFELKKLGQESLEEQADIVRILSPFVREGIENQDLLLPPRIEDSLPKPLEDIFLACEIASLFHLEPTYKESYSEKEYFSLDFDQLQIHTSLPNLQAERLDLSGITLKGANLSYANLQEADLREACLQEAYLSNANLQGANLGSAELQKANLLCANLQGANLSRGNWNELFQILDAEHFILDEAIFRLGADLTEANLGGANLQDANLSEAISHRTNLKKADFKNANLKHAELFGADLQGAKNLTVEQLLSAFIDEYTLLDPYFTDNSQIQSHIQECIQGDNYLEKLKGG